MMEFTWSPARHISDRIDSWYFRPAFSRIDAVADLLARRGIGLKQIKDLGSIDYGFMPTEDYYDETHGYPFIRTTNLDDNLSITPNDLKYINPDVAHQSRYHVHEGDVLLIQCGNYTGKVSYVGPRFNNWAFPSFSLRIRPKAARIDSAFLAMLLHSSYGQLQIQRTISITSVRPNTTKPAIESLQVPDFPGEIQHTIGNKLRKAERLRELAATQWTQATLLLSKGLDTDLRLSTFEHFREADLDHDGYVCSGLAPALTWVTPSDEIAAQYFHPRRINARLIASKSGRWNHLTDVAQRTRKVKSLPTYVGLDRIDSCTGIVSDHSNVDPGEDGAGPAFRSGDILFSRLRPYLNKVTIWTKEEAMGSGELLVYRVRDESDPFYIFFVLKSPIGLYQVIDVTAGSTHPRVDEEVVDAIRIPRLGQEKETEIGDRVRSAINMWYEAQVLVPLAKADVEALIDGTLDTERLLADGEAIEEWLSAHPSPHGKGGL